jgi:hypothetical protein
METKKNIYQKLLHIQQHINGLGKDKSAYSYKYVTGDKVLEHIKPFMNELGLLLKQEVISIENTRQDYTAKNGPISEINSKVMMKFTWVDAATGEKDENLFGANGQNAWDKGVGSALTYGERYFLLKFFHIATDEDDIDNPERKPEPVAKAAPKPEAKPAAKTEPGEATSKQKEDIIRLLSNPVITSAEKNKMLLNLNKLNQERAAEAIGNLTNVINERQTQAA